MKTKLKTEQRERRKKRIRAKVFGTEARPRLSIFKSNRYITLQIVNDEKGATLAYTSTKGLKEKNKAFMAGHNIALQAKAKKINKVVFDRGGYIYTGSVMEVAKGARDGGLEF